MLMMSFISAGGLLSQVQGGDQPPPPTIPPIVPPSVPPFVPAAGSPAAPPAMPPPPVSPTPLQPPVSPGPPLPPRKRMSWVWPVLGCGCLLLTLTTVALIYVGKTYWQQKVAPELQELKKLEQKQTPEKAPEDEVSPATTEVEEQPEAPAGTATAPDPNQALEAAVADKPNWVGKIKYISPDQQRVKVWIGPAGSEFANSVVLQWSSAQNRYVVERVDVIPAYQPPAAKPAATKATPSGPRPSRSGAVRAALAYGEGGWVSKVVRNSSDWRTATIKIGPPASEWAAELDLKWNGRRYTLTGSR